MNDIDISFVVPMHNAETKLGACLSSLRDLENSVCQSKEPFRFEVLFVDDQSTDSTYSLLLAAASERKAWRVLRTQRNSGSPSEPRNIGLVHAVGRYVFFLDGDDEIDAAGIQMAWTSADRNEHDVVRGPVEVHYLADNRRVTIDRLNPSPGVTTKEMLELIARGQSLNCSALWRRSMLIDNDLTFDAQTRMGEDIVFTAAAMTRAASIGYVDSPLFHYIRQPGGGNSSMHYYSGRELRELVTSWQAVEDRFQEQGLSYIELHGAKTVNYALRLVFRYHDRDAIGEEDIQLFADFFVRNRKRLENIGFVDSHVQEFVSQVSVRGTEAFWEMVRPRLLIAGHDLKFIKPAVARLREWFDVRVDEWPSEILHDEEISKESLAWADYVWVEWLTAASVWYAERVKSTQKLVVRMHRYELGRSYGDQIARDEVDAFIAIAPHCMEDMIERFKFDRSKVHYIPNYYQVDQYVQAEASDGSRLFSLAVIGAVPRRKGLLKSLDLLRRLRDVDDRYTLSILGKSVSEMPWVAWDPQEQAYFAACDEYVREHSMEDAVHWLGWSDVKKEARKYGFVLSTSEHEGSHVGPGEAFCAGNQGIFLRWRGAEFVYPEQLVFSSIEDMAKHVLRMQDLDAFNSIAAAGRKFMWEQYDEGVYFERIRKLFRSIG